MKISYAITVCNELTEIQSLLTCLLENKRARDEIVILFDSKGNPEVLKHLQATKDINLFTDVFNNDFAEWKNKLNSYCRGDYIFQIDADELPNKELILALPDIINKHKKTELFLVPRINTVIGITDADVSLWNWSQEDNGINWPDYQSRIYKNKPDIFWKNKVHEVICGYSFYTFLPKELWFSLVHIKTIEKQKQQNEFYSLL